MLTTFFTEPLRVKGRKAWMEWSNPRVFTRKESYSEGVEHVFFDNFRIGIAGLKCQKTVSSGLGKGIELTSQIEP
jgi:hypothetical protein